MIKAVTFDFWGTLYNEDDSALTRRREARVAVVQAFLAAAGRNLETPVVAAAIRRLVDKGSELHRREQRNYSHAEAGRALGVELGFDLTDEQGELLAEMLSSVGRQYPPIPADGVGQLLAQLHGKVRIGIVSDTGLTLGADLQRVMETHGLARYVDHFTWSDQTLTTKPMERQFLYTLGMLGVHPSEAVHVGDLEERDVAGARASGMRAIRILSGGDGRQSQAHAVAPGIAGVLPVLKRWGI